MHDEDREAVAAAAKADGPDADLDAHEPADDAQPESVPDRRPVHGLGAVGCLTMVLAAVAGMALLATGDSLAVAAGGFIIAVAIGVGLWLINAAGAAQK